MKRGLVLRSYLSFQFRLDQLCPASPGSLVLEIAPGEFREHAVRAIALWSYALHLIHTPTILLLQKYLPLAWQGSTLPASGMVLLEIALSLFLSALLYRYLESPCTHLRDHITPLRERPEPGAAVVA